MDNIKNILVVDDEKEITDLLEVYLRGEGYNVFKFYRAEGVMECLETADISLILLDVMLPDKNGMTLCGEIRQKWYGPIIMLTARAESADKIAGINVGADDYITKPFQPLEVLARVKAQLRRSNIYDRNGAPAAGDASSNGDEVYDVRGLMVNVTKHICTVYDEEILLTPMEFNILAYLCAHKDQPVSTEELFEKVWGEDYLDSDNTVMTHMARIREKLHENARSPKWIKTVWGVGYKFIG